MLIIISSLLAKTLPVTPLWPLDWFFSRENSCLAQPQSPAQNQNQRQFQHVKASKSMDLGTTQNQQPTGGESSLVIRSAWWLHASFPHRKFKYSHRCITAAPTACVSKPHTPALCTHIHSCTCRWRTIRACCMMSEVCVWLLLLCCSDVLLCVITIMCAFLSLSRCLFAWKHSSIRHWNLIVVIFKTLPSNPPPLLHPYQKKVLIRRIWRV